jgi:hypothetical protein
MASEQDEEEKQVSVEWRRTGHCRRIGLLGHGQLSHPIACSARATSVSLCARPVSLCMAAAAAALVICACVRSVCVRAHARVTCGGIKRNHDCGCHDEHIRNKLGTHCRERAKHASGFDVIGLLSTKAKSSISLSQPCAP